MSIPKANKWIQVEWNSGGRSVVNIKYLVKSLPWGEKLEIGTVVTVGRKEDGTPLSATVLASARDRLQLNEPPQQVNTEKPGTSTHKEEPQDFSPSGSDWEPSDDSNSEESEEDEHKKSERSKLRQYPGRKVLTPTHRPKAVVPNVKQQLAFEISFKSRKRIRKGIHRDGFRTLLDSMRTNKQNDKEQTGTTIELISSIKSTFQELFKLMTEIKPSVNVNDMTNFTQSTILATETDTTDHFINNTLESAMNRTVVIDGRDESDSDNSGDNVLITNKYDNVNQKSKLHGDSEWVPIGSGITKIHKDNYRKVNWKSYTIATRTLLLAVFSRRTLATHSLTGKKSPAFMNKQAKICLDPKKVSDIVIEITDKFKVKENLVRSIITTKCADECKMQKMKTSKKKIKNRENVPPGRK